MIATQEGQSQLVNLLISNGADSSIATKEQRVTPLHAAAMIDDFIADRTTSVEVAKMLIENGADVNTEMHTGETPVFPAASYGQVEVSIYYYQKGLKPTSLAVMDILFFILL